MMTTLVRSGARRDRPTTPCLMMRGLSMPLLRGTFRMSVTATPTAASYIEAAIRRYAGVQRAKAMIVNVAAALVVPRTFALDEVRIPFMAFGGSQG